MRGKDEQFPGYAPFAVDHPRVCGEKPAGRAHHPTAIGSPPRMRGKGQTLLADDTGVGITPAYAGKSIRFWGRVRLLRDHPRVCGEKNSCACILEILLGSPPRMRGKGPPFLAIAPTTGITPAYAGKSADHRKQAGYHQDHPRVCGEKVRPRALNGMKPWITPAYAGKSTMRNALYSLQRDHPRVCGEKTKKIP